MSYNTNNQARVPETTVDVPTSGNRGDEVHAYAKIKTNRGKLRYLAVDVSYDPDCNVRITDQEFINLGLNIGFGDGDVADPVNGINSWPLGMAGEAFPAGVMTTNQTGSTWVRLSLNGSSPLFGDESAGSLYVRVRATKDPDYSPMSSMMNNSANENFPHQISKIGVLKVINLGSLSFEWL